MEYKKDLLAPIKNVQIVDRDSLKPNNYNPNKVSEENLKLLTVSIFVNGFTLPIVVRPDMTIIDGFHRWTVSGKDYTYIPKIQGMEIKNTLYECLGGKVPIVIDVQDDKAGYMYGTITHNRARGTHLLEPMKAIIKELLGEGKSTKEICTQLGMKPEEVFRLSDFTREDFLKMMADNHEYGKAEFITRI